VFLSAKDRDTAPTGLSIEAWQDRWPVGNHHDEQPTQQYAAWAIGRTIRPRGNEPHWPSDFQRTQDAEPQPSAIRRLQGYGHADIRDWRRPWPWKRPFRRVRRGSNQWALQLPIQGQPGGSIHPAGINHSQTAAATALLVSAVFIRSSPPREYGSGFDP
jgi:hypothetical protein